MHKYITVEELAEMSNSIQNFPPVSAQYFPLLLTFETGFFDA